MTVDELRVPLHGIFLYYAGQRYIYFCLSVYQKSILKALDTTPAGGNLDPAKADERSIRNKSNHTLLIIEIVLIFGILKIKRFRKQEHSR